MEPESESSSKPVQSWNRTQNRVLAMDSLGIGIEFLDWTVSELESESKKLEPGTSVLFIYEGAFTALWHCFETKHAFKVTFSSHSV